MFTLRRFARILNLLAFLWFLFYLRVAAAESRLATLDEIQTLFGLATFEPQRFRVVADIVSSEPKWSEEQIAAEIKHQNEVDKDLAQLPKAQQQARFDAIARSHSGSRILHVQEWYSGHHYRLDQTDEGMVSERYLKDHSGFYRNTFVDIDDPASPYRSFFVDHQLADAQLSKTTIYAKNNLWRALGLEQELAFPLLIALTDLKSVPQGFPTTDGDLSTLRLDPSKAEGIHNGSDSIWHLEAITENVQKDRTRFILRGRTISLVKPYEQSDMEFVYDVGRAGPRSVCFEASLTNFTAHSAFISKREGFDALGLPQVWRRTTITPGSPPKQIDVSFKEIDLNPAFGDEEVFTPKFSTNYIVSDVTSGKAVVLQKPPRLNATVQSIPRPNAAKRMITLSVLGVVSLGMLIALLRIKVKKN